MITAARVREQASTLVPLVLPVALREAVEARGMLRARGLRSGSLVQARRAFLSRLHLLPPDIDLHNGLVIDVGANEGDFSAAMLCAVPDARVIAAEPNPEPCERLRRRLGDRVTVVPKAVGGESCTATFNITAEDHNSSLRQPRTAQMSELLDDPGWEVTRRLEVEVTTLDEIAGGDDVAVVKIDVQGAEMDVLRGGRETLRRAQAVLMEVTFISHYEADATFGPLHEEMTRQGFELASISSPARTVPEGICTWTDACYVPRTGTRTDPRTPAAKQ
jgi:FkbM family methyltransferase